MPDDSSKLMDALRAVSLWCGMPLSLAVDLVDTLKRLHAERAYADLRIEVKRGVPWRLHVTQTTQYNDVQ